MSNVPGNVVYRSWDHRLAPCSAVVGHEELVSHQAGLQDSRSPKKTASCSFGHRSPETNSIDLRVRIHPAPCSLVVIQAGKLPESLHSLLNALSGDDTRAPVDGGWLGRNGKL